MIGPVIDAALPVMRANAESMMLDRCTIRRATSTWDEVAQKTVTTWVPVVAESVCDVDDGAASGRSIVTDETVTRVEPSVYLPASVVGVEPDDRVTVTAVGPMTDPALLDAVMWVSHAATGSHVVECHLVVSVAAVSAGAEFSRFARALRIAAGGLESDGRKAVDRVAQGALRTAQAHAGVDSGDLRSSLRSVISRRGVAGGGGDGPLTPGSKSSARRRCVLTRSCCQRLSSGSRSWGANWRNSQTRWRGSCDAAPQRDFGARRDQGCSHRRGRLCRGWSCR